MKNTEKPKKSNQLIKVIVMTPITSEEASKRIKDVSKRVSELYSGLLLLEKNNLR